MATIVLSAVGAAIGGGFGGTVLGLSGAVIGRAVGATLGRVIDQRLMGSGSSVVEVGRVERIRVMGASEGAAIGQVFGRMRVAGQVIWATRFKETVTTTQQESRGGKGGAPKSSVVTESYSYSVSLAVALCEGEILRVGRIWADGNEIARDRLTMRVHAGSESQLPDAKIAAVEGAGRAPAYRGIAYVVFEDLDLTGFGNRVPQFSFEVMRRAQGAVARTMTDIAGSVQAVALIPGTGEYSLATSRVHYDDGPGLQRAANMHSPSGQTDFVTSLVQLRQEVPRCRAVSLVVSWFGDDLRCGSCTVRPKVEQKTTEGTMPWRAGGIGRGAAGQIATLNGRPVYGGTPTDQSVIEAIRALRAEGQEVMFYPFVLMEQMAGNALPDPWTGAAGQPVLPWRGRITLSVAPGRPGSPDRTAAASAEVAAFFGTAQPGHFARNGETVTYSGPPSWGYRRFVLHYAHLCAAAGGVEAFCIGSELRSLTQIRGAGDSFPAVAALRQLAADVRGILGPAVKLSYAADWSEYFGYHDASGNVQFHLDPLWADPNIDFIGIDNYMPVSDWRDGEDHADAAWGSIYSLDYLKANIAGGERFDWYYASAADAAAQVRTPIQDGQHGEPWVFRPKDLKNWWSNPHHDRVGGTRSAVPTAWVPRSKPVRFTEFGCPAIDKGTNQPNLFVDPKSSESFVPRGSNGRRDDLIQMQYLRAMAEFWADGANNPVSPAYGGRMVDMTRAYVWAWDARPYPEFPNLTSAWSDGDNYRLGHWLNGRATNLPLAMVVADLCEASGQGAFDVSRLYGLVRGYVVAEVGSARSALQPLGLAYGFDAVEREGLLGFRMRDGQLTATLDRAHMAVSAEIDGAVELTRAAEAEMTGRVRLGYVDAESSFEIRQAEAIFPDEVTSSAAQSELALSLTAAEGTMIAERWLAEARVARDSARFALPKSALGIGAGDVVAVDGARYRIDRIEQAEFQQLEAVRVEPSTYRLGTAADVRPFSTPYVAPAPVYPVFLDLPLLSGAEVPDAPHVAVGAVPWPGPVAVWSATSNNGYSLNRLVLVPATFGVTETVLPAARMGLLSRGVAMRVRLSSGTLSATDLAGMLNGANAAAIGTGAMGPWEVLQFSEATLVAPQVYELQGILRGQAGTEGAIPAIWPVGSVFLLLDRAPVQIALPQAARGLDRHYRIGAAERGYDDASTVHAVVAFEGIGLRPYRPVHLRVTRRAGGDRLLTWIRRTRIDGDGWHAGDVPLGEDREAYLVQVLAGASVVREVVATVPDWVYPVAQQAADGTLGGCMLRVAQLSDRFGPGPFAQLAV
jgi:hypothetical protein